MADKNKYDDIINLPHHVSKKHPQMSMANRAAQFMPFQALTGYGAAVKETARLTDRRIELDEYEKAELDDKLNHILDSEEPTQVAVTYFQPDERKEGGRYLNITGIIKKIDEYERVLVMEDKTVIPIDEVFEINTV